MYIRKACGFKCNKVVGELCSMAAGSPPQSYMSLLERQ